MPDAPALTPNDVLAYMGKSVERVSPEVVEGVIAAEQSAQAARCRIPSPRPADLDEALKRRVVRNLKMRNNVLGLQVDDGVATRIGGTDPEVHRLEAPYRKRSVG